MNLPVSRHQHRNTQQFSLASQAPTIIGMYCIILILSIISLNKMSIFYHIAFNLPLISLIIGTAWELWQEGHKTPAKPFIKSH